MHPQSLEALTLSLPWVYSVVYRKSVERDLSKLGKAEARKILERLDKELPRKADTCPLPKGRFAGLRKYRLGNYRVIFAILEDDILALRIRNRKDVHRKGI